MNRFQRSWLLLVLVLLCTSSLPPGARPALASPPALIHGKLHYAQRGPGSAQDGIANSMLTSMIGAPVATARLLTGFRSLASLPIWDGNPTMKQMSDFLREGVPVDLAQMLPIDASYSADIVFTLEQRPDGTYGLKEGTVRWTNNNNTQFAYEGGSMTDQLQGSGTATLDPATSDIKLIFDAKAKPATYDLTVNIKHPMSTQGKSEWLAADGAIRFTMTQTSAETTMDIYVAGSPEQGHETEPYVAPDYPIYYTHKGQLKKGVVDGQETWRTLLDAQAVIQYGLFSDCQALIDEPGKNDPLVFDGASPSEYRGFGGLQATPLLLGDDVEWTFPEVGGKQAEANPKDRRGRIVRFRYEGLPEKNSALGKHEFRAEFTSLKGMCPDPEPQPVRFFFERDSQNNPKGSEPNWFYYWLQTKAGRSLGAKVVYGGPLCKPSWYGYFGGFRNLAERDKIYICDLAKGSSPSTNPVTGRVTEGIDVFAATVLHEWTHNLNAKDWWPTGIDDSLCAPPGNRACPDKDRDDVPDAREAAYGLDPHRKDTLGLGFDDVEYPPFLQEDTWPRGAANKEDWAWPGKQGGGL